MSPFHIQAQHAELVGALAPSRSAVSFLDSRHITLFDVPEPREVLARFVYNFFVPDERSDPTGMPKFQGAVTQQLQNAIDTRVLEAVLPRYVEIEFAPSNAGFGNINDAQEQRVLSENKDLIQSEESTTTDRDATIQFQDPNVRRRVTGKGGILSRLFGAGDESINFRVELISSLNEGIDANVLEEVLAADYPVPNLFVNEVGDLFDVPVFSKAAQLLIGMTADRRLLVPFFGSHTDEGIARTVMTSLAKSDSLTFLPVASDDSRSDSDEPTVKVIRAEKRDKDSTDVTSMTVGYVVERVEIKSDGSPGELVKYYMDGNSNNRFLDTKILYGGTYRYVVKTVALVKMTVLSEGEENMEPGLYEVLFLISSRPSSPQIVKAVETIPPLEPDGVFYSFNYDDARGLFIRWQMPVGKQRDTKYFQVFRRRTIHEPFVCIAEIDFDDSAIKSPKKEMVNEDRVIRLVGPRATFMDLGFDRSDSYIYAITAMDAHGLTSGYSAQTLVSFDRVRNVLRLRNISRGGAPKQYPNFFIDPDLDDNIFVDSFAQDSMQISKKFSIRIYFDPDTAKFRTAGGDNLPLLATDNDRGLYKLHLLNIDRQKSAVLDLKIDDLRNSKPFEWEKVWYAALEKKRKS